MGAYSGQMWLAPHQSDKLEVEILIDEEAIRIISNGTLIGHWAMSEVEIGHVGQYLHLFVEGEQVVIAPTDPRLMPALLGPDSIEETPPPLLKPRPAEPDSDEGGRSRESDPRPGAHRAKRRMRWKW